jgi:putative membrane protein insertion efficiency factor
VSAPARLGLALIALYRALTAGRTPRCRFTPSCSAYAGEALAAHGARRGAALALRRLARCRPRGGYGYDPVPEVDGAASAVRSEGAAGA